MLMILLIKPFILFRQLCLNNWGVTVALIELLFSYLPEDSTGNSLGKEGEEGLGLNPEGFKNPKLVNFQFLFLSVKVTGRGGRFGLFLIYLVF